MTELIRLLEVAAPLSLSLLVLAPVARADVVTLNPSKDNTIYSDSGDLSNGEGDHLFAGQTEPLQLDALRRALLAFDIAGAIPAGSTIDAVTLTLFVSKSQSGDADVSLHKLLADWGESSSHAPGEEGAGDAAASGDATWTRRFYDTLAWSSDGGDFEAVASATTTVSLQGADYVWSSALMVTEVQSWLDTPANNFGWIVLSDESGPKSTKRFDSGENILVANRPELMVEFTSPGPSGACCGGDGACTLVPDPGGVCSGTYQGIATTCSPNPCPQPNGACCFADAAATCSDTMALDCAGQGGAFQGAATVCASTACPVVLEPYVDPLPLPAVAQPVSGIAGAAASYEIAARQVDQQLHRDLPPTTVWGYGDGAAGATFPGPTIEATKDELVTVTWINDLRDSGGSPLAEHHLAVDPCPHGAQLGGTRTVVHLHGAHTAAEFDGYPEDTIVPGEQDIYEYPNGQLPATLWYHDHALGITRLNTYMGLAGFYLIRDAFETGLALPSGEFEVPMAILDRTVNPDGSLQYPALWQEHFFGDKILVNGMIWPFHEVKQGKYRLRLLNASGSRTYTLSLSGGAVFEQIGSDGGLLTAPVTLNEITLSPAERADVVVDFEPFGAGTEIVMTNSAPAPFPGNPGVGVVPEVMKFVVLGEPGDTTSLPASLRPIETLIEGDAIEERDFVLRKESDACTGAAWLINGLHWDDITEYPELGTTEIWSFINRSGMTHPMHMHLVMFQVLDRRPFTIVNDEVVPSGPPVPPPPEEDGWKDTVRADPFEIVRVIARFEDFKGKFAYHCHIIEHEDQEMMRQYQTVLCGDSVVDPTEQCDDGDTQWVAGEFCRAECSALSCGDPNDSGGEPTATDALFVLKAGIGAEICALCVCDVDNMDGIVATDALIVLRRAVGQAIALACLACF